MSAEEIIQKIKYRFNTLQMSYSMEGELAQILRYLLVNGVDAEAFFAEFMAEERSSEEPIRKNEAKVLLGRFRERAVRLTGIGTPVSRTGSEEHGKTVIAWVEEDIKDDPIAKALIARADKVEYIKHYKDVFNAKGHDFKAEKRGGSFIVAKNRDTLIYPGAPFCQSFGNEHFYYASCVKNCLFDCDYCFLQGLYPCGYPVYFVNLKEYFDELDELLKKIPVYLCISYDTDLLAMEPMLHYVEKWVSYAQSRAQLKIEIRTKSGNYSVFDSFSKLRKDDSTENYNNIVFAWTISPKEVSNFAEIGLPEVGKRLRALKAAKAAGFPVRLCFDPMIYHPEWKKSYSDLFERVFGEIAASEVEDVSVGVFRISNKLLKRMRDTNKSSPITQFPYITENGACHYGELSSEMVGYAIEELKKYMPVEKIYAWQGN